MSDEKDTKDDVKDVKTKPEPEFVPEVIGFAGVDEQYQNYSTIHRAPL